MILRVLGHTGDTFVCNKLGSAYLGGHCVGITQQHKLIQQYTRRVRPWPL